MSEYTSYPLDFTRVPRFFLDWNKKFDVELMTATSNNFKFIFSNYAPSNIEECLTENGTLSSNVNVIATIPCSLKRNEECTTIEIGNNAEWTIGQTIYNIKAVFLCTANGYVMGYCIHNNSFEVTNKVKFDKGTILWSFQDG